MINNRFNVVYHLLYIVKIIYIMKEISIKFAEWVGINTLDSRYGRMKHEISRGGFHKWALDNHYDYMMTNKLYQKFCDSKGIEFTIPQKISQWDGEFEPTNFIEWIAKNNFFYLRVNDTRTSIIEEFWTKSGKDMGKLKFNTEELWNEFNK
jgi:hypothetical protein